MKRKILKLFFVFIFCITLTGCGLFEDVDYDDGNSSVAEITIGETAEYNKISWKVNECRNDTSIPTTLGGNITTNNNFVRVELIVFNGGETEYSPKLSMVKLRLKEPQALYEPKDYVYAHNRMGTKNVGAQMSVNYQIIFETPYKTSEKDFELLIYVDSKPARIIHIGLQNN